MLKYFFERLLKKKNFYISLIVGIILSVIYVCMDVYPYRDIKYGHSVYDIWMGGFSGSIIATLFYMIIPLIAVVPMSDTYISDKNSGYFQFVKSRRKEKEYFRDLFICNFITGGVVTVIPLVLNIYLCFMLIIDKKMDLIVGETHNITEYGKEVLFTNIYYEHPKVHVLITLMCAFLVGGVLASVALAISCFQKNIMMVWVTVFISNYLYEAISGIVVKDGAGIFQILTYAHQVAPLGQMGLKVFVLLISSLGIVSAVITYKKVVKYEVY